MSPTNGKPVQKEGERGAKVIVETKAKVDEEETRRKHYEVKCKYKL